VVAIEEDMLTFQLFHLLTILARAFGTETHGQEIEKGREIEEIGETMTDIVRDELIARMEVGPSVDCHLIHLPIHLFFQLLPLPLDIAERKKEGEMKKWMKEEETIGMKEERKTKGMTEGEAEMKEETWGEIFAMRKEMGEMIEIVSLFLMRFRISTFLQGIFPI
jgi:hypothetical protein